MYENDKSIKWGRIKGPKAGKDYTLPAVLKCSSGRGSMIQETVVGSNYTM